MRRVLIRSLGGPNVMEVVNEVDMQTATRALRPQDVLVQNEVAGVNFIDTYLRKGLYPIPQGLPATIGQEGAGVIVAVGDTSLQQRVGQRVGYSACCDGSYRSLTRVESSKAFLIPEGLPSEVATTVLVQGLTAHYLVNDSYKVQPGDAVLVHAAAGGTGLLATQLAALRGAANIIGLCRGAAKVQIAKSLGKCTAVIDTQMTTDWVGAVKELCPEGVHVVYDGIGKTTFADSLKCLRRCGSMISFGNVTGAVDPVAPLTLAAAGSVFLQRPRLVDYMANEEESQRRVKEVFRLAVEGKLRTYIGQRYSLEDVVKCHLDLEGRGTTGKAILTIPKPSHL